MKARSIWPTALVVALFGCSAGSVGPGGNYSNPGSGTSGGGSGLPMGYMYNDAGQVVTPDGAVIAADALPPPQSGSSGSATGGSSGGMGSGSSSGGILANGNPVISQTVVRLANVEYANTVNDLVGVAPSAQTVPLDADQPSGGYNVGLASTDATARAYHDSAFALAAQLTSTPANLAKLLAPAGTACATQGAACASAFIAAFAPQAFRRPVDAATSTALNGLYTTVAVTNNLGFTTGILAVVAEILQSPYYLYHLELEEQAMGPVQVAVQGYSMASRLSYFLWSSMPDAALFAAAQGGQLSTPAQIQAQAQRMLVDATGKPTAKAMLGLRNFYEQWLTVSQLPPGKSGTYTAAYTPAFEADLRTSLDLETEDALWSPTGQAMALLLTGSTSYATVNTAAAFGVTVTSTTPQKVQLDPTKRAGILSHPALMATYATGDTSHPIKRGRFISERFLCEKLPDPPPNAPMGLPPSTPGESLRQAFEALTATGPDLGKPTFGTDGQPLACPSCHSRINPLGFLFEPFNTIGAYRTIDDYGAMVDLSNITVVNTGDPSVDGLTATSMALATKLASSDLTTTCLMTQLYRYMTKRQEATADLATITSLDAAFTQNKQTLAPVLAAYTQTPAFLNRLNVQ
jgi:hypothetical protein